MALKGMFSRSYCSDLNIQAFWFHVKKISNILIHFPKNSKTVQNFDRQELGEVEKIFEEKISGKNADRAALNEMLSFVRDGDEVIVYSIDRLARDLRDLETIVTKIKEKGASISFITEKLKFDGSSDNALDKLLLQILGAFAEFERKIIRSRQAEGIARARERNAYKGRQATIDRAEINKLYAELKSVSKVAKAMNICRNSVYRNLEKVA